MNSVREKMTIQEQVVRELYDMVWSKGDYSAVAGLIGPTYTIHSDPGDTWEGQSLDRATYEMRVKYSRNAFPDLHFVVDEAVASGDRVAVRWCARGTLLGNLRELPATGRVLTFNGQTIYAIGDQQVVGHWQVIDRLGFVEQLRPRPA